ncbi:hypothetical protein BH09PSE5_BH09PSE5_27230 [soil metagenome]
MKNDFSMDDEPMGSGRIPLFVAADLQDDLLAATSELDRLQTLLSDACATLLLGFGAASAHMQRVNDALTVEPTPEQQQIDTLLKVQLAEAVTALQFQDMASQLIAHTHSRLRRCSDLIAQRAFEFDDDGDVAIETPQLRSSPVTQDQMVSGSVELF